MDKQTAIRIIRDTLEKPFDKGRLINFSKNLVNYLDDSGNFIYQGNYIPDAYKQYIHTLERIGKYQDVDNNKIDILIAQLKKETSLERARTMQRNFIAWYLNGSRDFKDAALVAFVSPDSEDWRFSLVKMDYTLEETPGGKTKVKTELTPARRWSFLVGENESSHTAQSQLVDILADDKNNPALSTLENAFNIEVATKEFFNRYRELFLKVKEGLDKLVARDKTISQEFNDKGIDPINFSKKLLGQIVFLYFLQKKGWLGVPENKNWGQGARKFLRNLFEKCRREKRNFFNDYLEFLFYDALNRQDRGGIDPSYYHRFDCRIPFLNGGLFNSDYDWVKTDIVIPNDIFSNRKTASDEGSGILDIFDLYNFTVKEDEPLEKEVAVDPEMLGKVFENLLEVKDRKSKGTYYTPREIVHYMCQESLINYLDTAINTSDVPLVHTPPPQGKLLGKPDPQQAALKTREYKVLIPREDIETLIRYGDLTIENEVAALEKQRDIQTGKIKSTSCKPILRPSIEINAKLIDDKLKNIRVCDPAIGSGAFPVGMMHEIIRARNTLSTYLPDEPERSNYNFKRHAIQNCLYGVDIDPGAVEIAKLRLWLSLVVDEEDIRQIRPLPNLDYKIMQGNSLISEFMGIDLDSINGHETKQLGFQDETDDLIQELERKKDEFHNKFHAEEKETLRQEIEDLIIKIFEAELQKQRAGYFEQIRIIEEKYKSLPNQKQREEIIKQEKEKLYKRNGFNLEKIEQQLREYTSSHKTRPFFPWKLYFSEIFHEKQGKQGFDVVIANPPYIRQEKIKDQKEALQKQGYEVYNSTSDLYTYFYERSYHILAPNGFSCFISSNKWMRAKYGEKLRKFFKERTTLKQIIDFNGYQVFDATVDTNILFFQKTKPSGNIIHILNIKQDFTPSTDITDYFNSHKLEMKQSELNSNCFTFGDEKILNLKKKIEEKGIPLKNWDVRICFGIKTGFNEAFIIDTATKERLCSEDPKSAEILKPILRGRDIEKYSYKWPELWLIKIESGWTDKNRGKKDSEKFLREAYPVIYGHLKSMGEKKGKGKGLYKRDDQGDYWWELRDCDYYGEFEKEKIIYPDIADRLSFAFENGLNFVNNTAYFLNAGNKYLLAVLNSLLADFYYRQISSQLGNKVVRAFTVFIGQIPIPKIPEKAQAPFIDLIDQILSITKDDDYLTNPPKQARVKEHERQIDQMVYQIYDLTPDEIAVVEGQT